MGELRLLCILCMSVSDHKSLNWLCLLKINCAYYIGKKEISYSDYPTFLSLHKKNGIDIGRSSLNNWAMPDSAVPYFTFFRFLDFIFWSYMQNTIEPIASGDAKSIKENYINFIFSFWISDFCSWLLGLNVDSASVNMRVHQGLGKLVRDSGPWLSLVCCFNHWVKLTIKHSFVNSSFEEISKLLTELYFLYQKSLKRHQNISRSIGKNCLDYIA